MLAVFYCVSTQVVKGAVRKTVIHRCESYLTLHTSVAQRSERAPYKRHIGVQVPAEVPKYRDIAKLVRHGALTATCAGSSPAVPAKPPYGPVTKCVS